MKSPIVTPATAYVLCMSLSIGSCRFLTASWTNSRRCHNRGLYLEWQRSFCMTITHKSTSTVLKLWRHLQHAHMRSQKQKNKNASKDSVKCTWTWMVSVRVKGLPCTLHAPSTSTDNAYLHNQRQVFSSCWKTLNLYCRGSWQTSNNRALIITTLCILSNESALRQQDSVSDSNPVLMRAQPTYSVALFPLWGVERRNRHDVTMRWHSTNTTLPKSIQAASHQHKAVSPSTKVQTQMPLIFCNWRWAFCAREHKHAARKVDEIQEAADKAEAEENDAERCK